MSIDLGYSAIRLHPYNPPTGVKATAIAAGAYHGLAIGSDGNMYAWGANGNGELGNGTNADSSTPVVVHLPPGMTPLALRTGSEAIHSLAILSGGAPTAAILSGFHPFHAGTHRVRSCLAA